jgi:hypothetical protein
MNRAPVVEPLTAFSHTGHAATSAQRATLAVDDNPARVRFTVWTPLAGDVVWTFPLDLLDEAQTGPACRESCHAWPMNSRFMGIALPVGGGDVQAYWLFTDAVNRFRAAAFTAEFTATFGGTR